VRALRDVRADLEGGGGRQWMGAGEESGGNGGYWKSIEMQERVWPQLQSASAVKSKTGGRMAAAEGSRGGDL
jgi:hypothetical protein